LWQEGKMNVLTIEYPPDVLWALQKKSGRI
jgi:hypothetical protein